MWGRENYNGPGTNSGYKQNVLASVVFDHFLVPVDSNFVFTHLEVKLDITIIFHEV